MKKFLLKVTYTDDTGKWWHDSYIKNTICQIQENETVHQAVARVCLDTDGMKLTYNAKPKGNIFVDTKSGETKIVGYMYRGQTEIQDDKNGCKWHKANFDVWATLHEINDFEFQSINP